MLNQYDCIGNLTRDAQVITTQSGKQVGKFSIAVNEVYIDPTGARRESVCFWDVTVWKDLVQQIKDFKKGQRVFLTGKIVLNTWTDDNNQPRSKHEVTAFKVIPMAREPRPTNEDSPVYDPEAQDAPIAAPPAKKSSKKSDKVPF